MIIKVGRLTAAVLLISVGAVLLIDRWQGTAYLGMLLEWWPLVLILLGLEYLYFGMKPRAEGVQLRLDIASIVGAVLLSALIGVVTNWPSLSQFASWTRNVTAVETRDIAEWFDNTEAWQKANKGVTAVPLSEKNRVVAFHNNNGRIKITSGAVDDVQIDITVSAPGATEEEMDRLLEETGLEIKDGSTLNISSKSVKYGSGARRGTRSDWNIVVPEGKSLTWEIHGINGDLEANGLTGTVKMFTTNGDVKVGSNSGEVEAYTTNGDIEVFGTDGDIRAETTLGDVFVDRARGSLTVQTTNGDVEASGEQISGNWKVETTLGDVELKLPLPGDYSIQGESTMGDVELDADDQSVLNGFTVSKKSIEGKVGTGNHRIEAHTQRDLSIILK
jgi:DUF4097 and DUF4098 domain-containing protein YvlB